MLPVNGTQSAASTTESIELTAAEYFAGIGLFRMGLEATGWRVAYANDWSHERAQMYKGFFGRSDHYDIRDIFAVKTKYVPATTLATCSFPCIDLSLAGKRNGLNAKYSGAFWGFLDRLREQGPNAPPIVLLENVTGWMYSNDGGDFYATAKALNDVGYTCDVFMLNARSFVPQSRPRLFMIGFRDGPVTNNGTLLSSRSKRLLPPRLRKLITEGGHVDWAWLDIPEPPPYRNTGLSEEIVENMGHNDSRWWSEYEVERHLAMMSPQHLTMVKNIACLNEEHYRTFFRRVRRVGQRAEVRSDDIAGCLRTAVGGSGKQFLVAAGNNRIRMRTLTPREYARLQGVPDHLPIVSDTIRQALSAFGDAVCVPVVSWIATQVLHPLVETMRTRAP